MALAACEAPATRPVHHAAGNVAPQATDDAYSIDEDATLDATRSVLVNDEDADSVELVAELITPPEHGEIDFRPDGTFTYVPAPDYSGPDRFSYRVSDGSGESEADVEIDVLPVNDPPAVAIGEGLTVASDGTLEEAVVASDVDGDPLTFDVAAQPSFGTVTLQPSGSFIYSPTLGYAGPDAFSISVSDGKGASETAIVPVTVTALALATETPFPYAFVRGPLPGFACDIDGAFSIVSMTPATGTTLAPDATYDFTAVVQYATKVTDTIYLEAYDDVWNRHSPTPAEKFVVEPSNGCAQTTVTLHGVSTAGTRSLELQFKSERNKLAGSGAIYFVSGGPEVRIVGSDHDLNQPLPLDANGEATIRLQVAWKNLPQNWIGYWQYYTPSSYYHDGNYQPVGHTGSTVVKFTVRPGACTDTFGVIGPAIQDDTWTYGAYHRTHVYFSTPALLPFYDDMPVQATTATKKNHTLSIRNCSGAPQAVSLSTAAPWLYPQAASAAVAAGAKVDVTYATDAQALLAGRHSSHLLVHSGLASPVSLPITLFAANGSYTVSAAIYDWISEAVTPPALLSAPYQDWVDYPVDLPFALNVFGVAFDQLTIGLDGHVSFAEGGDTARFRINVNDQDLQTFDTGGVYAATLGDAPNRIYVVTWYQVGDYADPLTTRSAQMALYEGSDAILVQYETVQAGDKYWIELDNGEEKTTWTPAAGSAFWLLPQ